MNEGSQGFSDSRPTGSCSTSCPFTAAEFRLHPADWPGGEEDSVSISLLETYVKLRRGTSNSRRRGFDVLGQGAHDTLLLSNNAEPLPVFKITNPCPRCCPGSSRLWAVADPDLRVEARPPQPVESRGSPDETLVEASAVLRARNGRTALFGGHGGLTSTGG